MAVGRLAQLSSYDYNNYKLVIDKGVQEWDPMSRFVPAVKEAASPRYAHHLGPVERRCLW